MKRNLFLLILISARLFSGQWSVVSGQERLTTNDGRLTASNGQEASVQFDRIPSELGLSQNLIKCILQDRKGFLWFGTNDGLNRFDGYKFTVYQHDPYNPTSLSDSAINALHEDRDGRIWVGTQNGLNPVSYTHL